MSSRTTTETTVTRVHHVAKPAFETHENGPHLDDLREFVTACEGLPDEVLVRIDLPRLDEGGRRDVTFEVNYLHPKNSDATS